MSRIYTMKLDRARSLVRANLQRHLYETAIFWADKAVSISQGSVQDVFMLAQTLFLAGHYRRAAQWLTSKGLVQSHLMCRYLAAQCHAHCGEWKSVVDLLDIPTDGSGDSEMTTKELSDINEASQILPTAVNSAICYLRGVACQALENRLYTKENYKEALRLDVFCYEAFDGLISHHLLTLQEAKDFLDSLPFNEQCTDSEEQESLKFLYYSQLDAKSCNFKESDVPPCFNQSLDIAVVAAEQRFASWDHDLALQITRQVIKQDAYHPQCVLLHVGCLVELEKTNDLFLFAHKLVDNCPQEAISWYAVGCYYLSCKKFDTARQFFSKATTIDPLFGEGWLAFGHAFAYEGEHDQAVAAYQTAARHMPGCHLPLLFIGQEYVQMDNALAEKFLNQALVIAPEDPDVLHEMGVLKYQSGVYSKAEKYLEEAIGKVEKGRWMVSQLHWEALLNNYGHVCRKLGKFDDALQSHLAALRLAPNNPSTHSLLGFVCSLTGQHMRAVEEYHKALELKREDTLTVQLLNTELELLADDDPLQGVQLVTPAVDMDDKSQESTENMDGLAQSESLSSIEID